MKFRLYIIFQIKNVFQVLSTLLKTSRKYRGSCLLSVWAVKYEIGIWFSLNACSVCIWLQVFVHWQFWELWGLNSELEFCSSSMQNTFKGLKHDDKPLLFLLLSKQITEMGIYHYSWWLNCNYQKFSIDFFFPHMLRKS